MLKYKKNISNFACNRKETPIMSRIHTHKVQPGFSASYSYIFSRRIHFVREREYTFAPSIAKKNHFEINLLAINLLLKLVHEFPQLGTTANNA